MTLPQKGNIRMLFDPIEELEIDTAVSGGIAFRRAKGRLLMTIADPPRLNPDNEHRLLGRWIDTQELMKLYPKGWKVPWGWRIEKCQHRDLFRMMPLWLWWPRYAWDRRYIGHMALIRLGFLVGPQGGYYATDFRWSWRFWRSQRVLMGRETRYQQLCYWLLRKESEYYRDVPRPFTYPTGFYTTITTAVATFFRPGDVIEITGADGKKITAVLGETTLDPKMGFTLNIIP